MNVSAKSEYGLRALIVLADRASEGLVPARQIAESCEVPIKYLEQILKALRDGGLVEGQVGAAGGYRLTRPGIMSSFPARLGTQNEWMTSFVFRTNSTGTLVGMPISFAVTSFRSPSGSR